MTHLSLFMLGFTVVLIANFISLTKAERRLVPTVLFKEVTDIRSKWLSGEYEDKDHHYEVLLEALAWYKNEYDRQRRRLGEINRANLVASFAESQEQDIVNAEIGTDASFKPRRLAATEQSIFEELSSQEFEQWIDIMSRIKWTSLNAGDRRRLSEKLEHKKVRIQPVNPGAPLTRYGWIMKVEYGATNEPKELEIFEPVMNGELSAGATEVFSTRRDWDPNPEEINPQYLRTYTWSGHRWVTWVDSATEQKCMIKVVEDEADQPEPLQGGEK